MGAGPRGELDSQTADSTGGTDDEQHVALGQLQGVDRGDRRDARQRRGAGGGEIDAGRHMREGGLLGDADQLRPAAVVHGRVGVPQELYTRSPMLYRVDLAELFHHAGVVASQDDG